MRSASDARLAAAARFARHSRMEQASSGSSDSHAAQTLPAEGDAPAVDWSDYDAFLEARGPRLQVASPSPPAAASDSAARGAQHIGNNATADAAAGATSAPSVATDAVPFVSEWTASFGTPVRPASAAAAQRRLYFMRRVLMHSTTSSDSSRAGPSSAAAAAAAAASVDATLSAAAAAAGASVDYFDEEEMEKRRPQLYHDYIGQYRERAQQRSRDDDDSDDEKRRADDDEQEAEERKMSDATPPPPFSRPSVPRGPRLSTAAAVKRAPQPLPETLSQLLLRNYDRAQLRQQVRASQPAPATTTSAAAPAAHANPASVGAPSSGHGKAGHTRSAMLDSDESELSSSDDEDGGGAGHSSMGRMRFEADDGRPNDGSFRGPTSSAAAAALAMQMVDDDMDTGGNSNAARRRPGGSRLTYAQAYAAAAAQEEAGVAPLPLRDDGNEDSNNDARQGGRAGDGAGGAMSPSSSSASEPFPVADPLSSRSEQQWLECEFLRIMQRLFLDGFDGAHVRYSTIDQTDLDDDREWIAEREAREQEAYFEADEYDEQNEEGATQRTSFGQQTTGGAAAAQQMDE